MRVSRCCELLHAIDQLDIASCFLLRVVFCCKLSHYNFKLFTGEKVSFKKLFFFNVKINLEKKAAPNIYVFKSRIKNFDNAVAIKLAFFSWKWNSV